MKTRTWIVIIALSTVILGAGVWYRTAGNGGDAMHNHEVQETVYYCPMHPDYTSDKPGKCPICGMDLVANADHKGHGAVTITPEQQKLIGVGKTKIEMKDAKKIIRTSANVAFDTELAVAQREYIESKRAGDKGLIEAARQRLFLMGMNREDIDNLRQVEKNLYSPEKTAWVYLVIYENELPLVNRGQTVKVELPSGGEILEGKITSVDSVLDNQTRTARARAEILNKEGALRPNMYLNAVIEIDLGRKLLVPKDAVLGSGERNVVFVVHEENSFMPHEVILGPELADDYVVESGISEGDEVVTGANFLIDAESKLKTVLGSIGGHNHGE